MLDCAWLSSKSGVYAASARNMKRKYSQDCLTVNAVEVKESLAE